MKQDKLSIEPAKQQQTMASASEPSATTTGTPLPHGDTLITIKKLKQEKNDEGRENDFKRT